MSSSGLLHRAVAVALVTGVTAVTLPVAADAMPKGGHARKHHAKKKHHHKKHHASAPATTPPAPAPAAPGTIHVVSDAIAAPGFHITFDATRPGGAPATTTGSFGPFRGEAVPGALLGSNTVAGFFAGPVQCLQATAHEAALFYPIQSADPAALAGAGGVFIYLQDGGPGQPDHVTFLPVPQKTVTDCPVMPGAALMPTTTGDITIDVAG